MDTKYLLQAFNEYIEQWKGNGPKLRVPTIGELPLSTLCLILQRAQSFKDADQRKAA